MTHGTEPPYDIDDDYRAAEYVECDRCEKDIIDGHPDNGRVNGFYLCPDCYGEVDAVVCGRVWELRQDEAQGK